VLVKEARSTVADDDIAIGEWARIGIGQLTFLRCRSPTPTSCVYRKLKPGRNDGEVRRVSGVNE
jgi:hypothetical protein